MGWESSDMFPNHCYYWHSNMLRVPYTFIRRRRRIEKTDFHKRSNLFRDKHDHRKITQNPVTDADGKTTLEMEKKQEKR